MRRLLASIVLFVAPVACIKAPEIVMVDRATALEQQASGSFEDLERRLARGGIAPRPVPFTPSELEALGIGPVTVVDNADPSTADRVDALLVQRCIGEGRDGQLVDTHERCHGAVDRDEMELLIDRVNRARTQLWRWMHEQRPGGTVDDMRRGWHDAHLLGVVCGGWIEGNDGRWQAKSC